jgi:hypothetical protein
MLIYRTFAFRPPSRVVSTQRYARVSNNRVKQDYFEGMRKILSKS